MPLNIVLDDIILKFYWEEYWGFVILENYQNPNLTTTQPNTTEYKLGLHTHPPTTTTQIQCQQYLSCIVEPIQKLLPITDTPTSSILYL